MRCGAFCSVLLSAAVAAQAPEVCADNCGATQEHVAAAAARIDQDRNQFVAAVGQLIQAVPGRDVGGPSRVAASVDGMARALERWDQSLRTYRTVVLDAAGQSADARVALSGAYLERGRGQEALKEARVASALDPARPDAFILQGLAHDLAKRPLDAAQAFAKAAKISPGSAAATYGLAQRLIAASDEAGATAALRQFDAGQSIDARRPPTPARAPSAPFVRAGLLRQTAGVAPLFPPAPYARGFALLADGALDQAIVELRASAASERRRVRDLGGDPNVRLAMTALGEADLRSVIDQLELVAKRWPDRAEPRQMLGLTYEADEQYGRSIEHLTAAVELNAADELGYSALADVLVLAGRPDEAERVLRRAFGTLPVSGGGLHYQLALLYQSTGRKGDAIRELEQAATFPPVVGQDHLYDLLGVLYTSDADLEGALGAYRRRVRVNPNNSDAHRKLAQIYLEQSRHEEAWAEFGAALLLDPANAEAWAGRAQVRLRLGDYAGAVNGARRALALNRAHAAAQYTLGTSLLRLGQVEEGTVALEEFRRLQTAAQAAADREWELKLLRQAAQNRLDAGDPDAAAASLQQVVARQPDVAANHITLGLVLQRAGRHAAAIDAYRQALAISAEADVHGHLAAAYAALGREAERQAEQALADRQKENRIRTRGFGR